MKKAFFLLIVLLVANAIKAQNVPVITFEELQQRFDQKNDTVYVYNFWATWCKPCVEELPSFEKLNTEYAGKKVKVVLLSLDFKSQLKKLEAFVAKKQMKAEVVLLNEPDYNSWIDRVSTEWGGSIPATYVVHQPSGARKFHEGQFSYAELQDFIKPIITQR
jgi:thiol-disulfide isomerase/thioredoxin